MKNSNRYLEAVRNSPSLQDEALVEGGLVHQPAGQQPVAPHQIRRWAPAACFVVGTVLLVTGVIVGVWKMLTVTPTAVAVAPAWSIEILSSSKQSTLALVYGEDAGIHLVRVPGTDAPSNQPQIISARLANAELHLISLSLWPLRVRSTAPTGTRTVAWSAQGHVVTAFQDTRGTGVQTW